LPPLAQILHVRVVKRHFDIEPLDIPTVPPQTKAQIRLFASDQRTVEPSDASKGIHSNQRIAATGFRRSHRRIPLDITQPGESRPLRVPLAPAAAYNRGGLLALEKRERDVDPSRLKLAIAVDKLHELHTGMHFQEALNASISGARGGESPREV
jgi:hypothetical protein